MSGVVSASIVIGFCYLIGKVMDNFVKIRLHQIDSDLALSAKKLIENDRGEK